MPASAAPAAQTLHPDWLVPDWPVPLHVRALCTTRAGGQSRGVYESLNLGCHVGDDAAHVQANRQVLQSALGVRPVFLSQVHGVDAVAIAPDTPDGTVADACFTTQRGVACTIMVADCLPVLFSDLQGRVVAAAHAGWRGLVGEGGRGVLEQTVDEILAAGRDQAAQAAIKNEAIYAWLGPCIGPDAFEVGDEVRTAFVAGAASASACFRPAGPGKWWADLPGLARLRLAALGVTQVYGNDGSTAWCTVSQSSRFFSHRRDKLSGRLAACIWLD